VLPYFESARPNDDRPRRAIEATYAWVSGEITMKQARVAAGAAQDAGREVKEVSEAARMAALSAGQAAVVAHVAAHELGAAAYAIRAVMAESPKEYKEEIFPHVGETCRHIRETFPSEEKNFPHEGKTFSHEGKTFSHEGKTFSHEGKTISHEGKDFASEEYFRLQECQWQRERLPERIRDLVIDDQRLRNDICWFVFS
jgi:hypothetical protein